MFKNLTKRKILPLIVACSLFLSSIPLMGMFDINAASTVSGMLLNFESGTRDVTTGTHPGYESYYGKPGDVKNGNASRINGFNVGYVDGDGVGHNSDGAMRIAFSENSESPTITGNAAFNLAHTGTNANTLANFRPMYGKMFRATVWYKVTNITSNAELAFYNYASTSDTWSGGQNLSLNGIPRIDNVCGTGASFHSLKKLTSADVAAGWQSASVVFMGGGTSTATDTGHGGAGYITLVMEDNTKRLGTEVYIDDISIEYIGDAVQVNYNLDGGTLSNCTGEIEYGVAGSPFVATAVKPGHRFDGWYSDSSYTTPVSVIGTTTTTVYAKWKSTSYAGMKLNFETGPQSVTTGTHPGYESYYGKPGDAKNGNATRVNGFDVGYVNATGVGRNSNGAMKMSYSNNSTSVTTSTHASFNTAHTGTSETALANYRPYYGQIFRATVWYKVESLTVDASLNFYVASNYTGIKNGANLNYGGSYGGTPFANLTSADVGMGWQQASVTFMGGGSSTASVTGAGSAGYIELMMSDNTNRMGTVVYIDDITIEHLGEAVKVNYELDGGKLIIGSSETNETCEYGLSGQPLNATAKKDGFVFDGWFAEETCVTSVTLVPSAETTLYAKWRSSQAEDPVYPGMTLNFETGDRDITTGTHPGYESYYGKPGTAKNGNATRGDDFDVGYINESGAGHDSDGAMRVAFNRNSSNTSVLTNAGFNIAHTGTSAAELKNYRPQYGQKFRATIWYKVDSLTTDAELQFYSGASMTGTTGGINLNYSGVYSGNTIIELKAEDVGKGWQSATVEFVGGGTSTETETGAGCPGYILLSMNDNTKRVGTVVYIDDVKIEHIASPRRIKFECNGGASLVPEVGFAGDTIQSVAKRRRYEFMGWYAEPDLITPVTTIPNAYETTLYAKWEFVGDTPPYMLTVAAERGNAAGSSWLSSEVCLRLPETLENGTYYELSLDARRVDGKFPTFALCAYGGDNSTDIKAYKQDWYTYTFRFQMSEQTQLLKMKFVKRGSVNIGNLRLYKAADKEYSSVNYSENLLDGLYGDHGDFVNFEGGIGTLSKTNITDVIQTKYSQGSPISVTLSEIPEKYFEKDIRTEPQMLKFESKKGLGGETSVYLGLNFPVDDKVEFYIVSFFLKMEQGAMPSYYQTDNASSTGLGTIYPAYSEGDKVTFFIPRYPTQTKFQLVMFFPDQDGIGYLSDVEVYAADENYRKLNDVNVGAIFGNFEDWYDHGNETPGGLSNGSYPAVTLIDRFPIPSGFFEYDPLPELIVDNQWWNSLNVSENEYVETGSVRGQILDAKKNAMSDISVVLDSGITVLKTKTDSKGNFSFDKVPVGVYDIYIKINDEDIYFEDQLIDVLAQDDLINIDLVYDGETIAVEVDNDDDAGDDATEENTPTNSGGKKRVIKKVRRVVPKSGFFEQYWWLLIPLGLIIVAVPVLIIIIKKRKNMK